MFKASSSWILKCEKRLDREARSLIKLLPKNLQRDAQWVLVSNKSWEWKHFWFVNAKLWHQQAKHTQKIRAEWSSDHDQLFEAWNKSEHAATFLKALNSGLSIQASSRLTLAKLAQQLEQLSIRHFARPGKSSSKYQPQFELGEFPMPALSEQLNTGKSSIEFYSWDKKSFPLHLERISEALGIIKTFSPDSYVLLEQFTRRIVPIKQKEFVSYSLQSLPGHSFINLYHRDRLDLLDDLLHENGHHHLNYFLILEEPLREDPDQIYYSPWRRTLRPVRGIYHAHLTFFFALKLYHDLATAQLQDRLIFPQALSKTELQKVFFRYLEEWLMLEYTAKDLLIAIERGQVRPSGVKLFNAAEAERKKLGSLQKFAWQKITAVQRKKLKDLTATLTEQARLTREM